MINSFIDILREYPTLAIFLTVGLGFFIGKLRIGSFSIGSVTAVLLVGVLVGQLAIPVSGPIKMFFFMMFLFSIGYSGLISSSRCAARERSRRCSRC